MMIQCTCSAPAVEFTVVKDELSKVILLEAYCHNCGKMAHGKGKTLEQALREVGKEWRKKGKNLYREA